MKWSTVLTILGVIAATVPLTSASIIVPEEFATLLGLVFSTIPQVKKGTDSRVGFGYRFGNHADAQVVFEIGPQTETKKLGDGKTDNDTFNSKRQVNPEDFHKTSTAEEISGGDWLKSWSKNAQKGAMEHFGKPSETKPSVNKIKVKPFIAESSLKQLMKLYSIEGGQAITEDPPQKPVNQFVAISPEEIVTGDEDSQVQFQDRHRVFLKRPTADKLDNYSQLKHDKKKASSVDLMDVSLD